MDRIVRTHVLACVLLCIDPEEEINASCCLPNSLLLVGFQSEKTTSVGHLNPRHRHV
jgi:hypothetical protein